MLARVSEPVERHVSVYLRDFVFAVSFFLRKKRGTIPYQKLKVSCIRLVQVRIVDFVDYSVGYGEPNAALMAYSCAYAAFSA
jgi:hypothetical protein